MKLTKKDAAKLKEYAEDIEQNKPIVLGNTVMWFVHKGLLNMTIEVSNTGLAALREWEEGKK